MQWMKIYHFILIRTADSDVVVLAVSFVNQFTGIELWSAFGTGKHFRYIAVHEIALSSLKSVGLRMFHALTGCDIVSFFSWQRQKTAWETWKVFPCITGVLGNLSNTITSVTMKTLTCSNSMLFYCMTELAHGKLSMTPEMYSSRYTALAGSSYSACKPGIIWGRSCMGTSSSSSTVFTMSFTMGLELKDDTWEPVWTLLPWVQIVCKDLISCGCKKECKGRRKCFKAHLECTTLCACGGACR